jgi:Contractile injection system tube protein
MGLLNLFKLEKLKINAYENSSRKGEPTAILKVMFNPESYSLSYENNFSKLQGIGKGASSDEFILSKPENLSLKIIIDGTGVSEQGIISILNKKDVYGEVQHFLKNTTKVAGNIHEPKYLTITWGKLNFKCRLQSVTINYTLFDESGNPLRAELDTTFITDIGVENATKLANLTSPDLTHKRIVKEHDTLPLLCEAIYGTPDYYLEVAKANNLTSFRLLHPGQELFFPPINK